jgi:hypothetical protein
MKTCELGYVEFSDVNKSDYPDFADAFVSYAEWLGGIELTESELEELNKGDSFPYEMLLDRVF